MRCAGQIELFKCGDSDSDSAPDTNTKKAPLPDR